MPQVVIENPILNSPYKEPARHFKFSDDGITDEIVESRRISTYFVPIAKPRKKAGGKQLALDTGGGGINWDNTWGYAGGLVKTALERGYRLGFVGELDLHLYRKDKEINTRKYCYTGVVADNLTREDIFEALKARHTYAVWSPFGLGKKILVKATSGNHLMGDIFTIDSDTLTVTLQGKTDLTQFTLVNLIVNGRIVESRTMSKSDFVEEFSVKVPDGDNYVFCEVVALSPQGPEASHAFTSPMYVTVGKLKE